MALGTDFARIAFTSMALISPLCITYKENGNMIFYDNAGFRKRDLLLDAKFSL